MAAASIVRDIFDGIVSILGWQTSWILGALLSMSLVGCKEDSSCAGGNGKMCDIFSLPLKITQDQPRLHFTGWQVTEGACELPRCDTPDCTALVLVGLFYQLEVTASTVDASPPDTRCRYQISSAEGESLDVLLSLSGSSPVSFCCDTGLRTLVGYSWSAFANGVELARPDILGFRLPRSFDGGATRLDATSP